jgi:hypothetical protein
VHSDRLQRVLDTIDELNGQDPNKDIVGDGTQPHELAYSKRLTNWVLRLNPKASEELLIVARGQHVQRWTIPRGDYEKNRKDYLRWREALKTFHAETVSSIMLEAGYDEAAAERVARIIRKRNLKDPDTQTIEDALCLVFLETQFEGLLVKTPEDKMFVILRKTWGKMSKQGREIALTLELPSHHKAIIQKALLPT